MSNDKKYIGCVIREARDAKAMTQAELAESISVSLRTIVAIENGKRNPSFEVLYQIIRALDIPADLIFRPENTPNTPEQEQFIREFLSANTRDQHAVMLAVRGAWRGMYETNE